MVIFKTKISDKERSVVYSLLMELTDVYGDFYITKNNLRLHLKENQAVLFDALKAGDYIAYDETGMAIVTGYSDKSDRKYLKILSKDPLDANKYLKVITWNLNTDLYVKIKRNNPLKNVLLHNGFKFKGGRGKELLLVRPVREEAKNVSTDKTKD